MKTLGLLGGLSWVSTLYYYRYINEGVNERLGGLRFAECVVYSLDFGELQARGWDDWPHTLDLLLRAGRGLKAAGAEAIVLCANTAHVLADEVEARVGLPIIHIATATAQAIAGQGLRRVGLLGTKFTMEQPFFHEKLRGQGIDAITPDAPEREYMQHTLREELGRGIVTAPTKAAYLRIIEQLLDRGAQGIVFGCTEIPLLLGQRDVRVPVFDTTRLHARAAVAFALGDRGPQPLLKASASG
jgi:aspartate racemase